MVRRKATQHNDQIKSLENTVGIGEECHNFRVEIQVNIKLCLRKVVSMTFLIYSQNTFLFSVKTTERNVERIRSITTGFLEPI